MFAPFFVLLALGSPAPLAAATSAPAPLREIGRVRASASCASLAVHANSAISSVLHNDLLVGQTTSRLREVDLDGSPVARRNGLQELGRLALDLRAEAVAGVGEVKRLRQLAEKSRDSTQKKELKAFADSLGGALYRQKKIANDLNGFLAAMDYHDMANFTESQQDMNRSTLGQGDARLIDPVERAKSIGRNPRAQSSSNEQAKEAADDFARRVSDITNDEGLAAQHTEGAISGC
ncbi:MAG: hypothetical protein M3Z14_05235 [Candidatus Eremiobacteraeota bacterium]|nr:hypothetical protein [Candidatus Eremiobacteraeota bacterium]